MWKNQNTGKQPHKATQVSNDQLRHHDKRCVRGVRILGYPHLLTLPIAQKALLDLMMLLYTFNSDCRKEQEAQEYERLGLQIPLQQEVPLAGALPAHVGNA